jgi:iron complex outermembrane receptor protein
MKNFYVLLAGIFLNTLPSFAQKKLSFTLNKQQSSCETDSLPTNFFITINQFDSVVPLAAIKQGCIYSVVIPSELYQSKLILKSRGFHEETLPITLKQNYPDSLYIGTINLARQKTKVLNTVTISGIPKDLIKVQGNKTVIQVKDNEILTISSIYDAIKKIPGSFITPNGDITYQGKGCEIYLDGLPSNLMGQQLIGYLKSFPATSVERIEIILNPGAAYDANLQGAIFDIITKGSTSKWVAGTLSLNYGKNQNDKITPSLVLNGKRKKYSWQFQSGLSSIENTSTNNLDRNFISFTPEKVFTSSINAQNTSNSFYLKPSASFKLSPKSQFVINYNVVTANVSSDISSKLYDDSKSLLYNNISGNKTDMLNQEVIAKYKSTLDTLGRVLEVTGYSSWNNGINAMNSNQIENNTPFYNFYNFKNRTQLSYIKADLKHPTSWINLTSGIKLNTEKFSNNGDYMYNSTINNNENANGTTELKTFNYQEDKIAFYTEFDKTIQKWNIGGGLRWESNLINRESNLFTSSLKNSYHNLFPNVYANYSISNNVLFNMNYARKIAIPTANQFDPNSSNFYDKYFNANGNFNLQPKYYDNAGMSITAFNYLQFSINYSRTTNENMQTITAVPNSLQVIQTSENYKKVENLTLFGAVPVPFLFFKEGKKMFEKPLNPEQMNYLYLYSSYSTSKINGYNFNTSTPHFWSHGVVSHFVLPYKLDLNITYNYMTKGYYQIYFIDKPIHFADITLNRSFLNKSLNASINISDPFNTNRTTIKTGSNTINVLSSNKQDTRVVYINLSYSFGKHKKLMNEKTIIDKEVKEQNKGMI